jgi:hypothetical protein
MHIQPRCRELGNNPVDWSLDKLNSNSFLLIAFVHPMGSDLAFTLELALERQDRDD